MCLPFFFFPFLPSCPATVAQAVIVSVSLYSSLLELVDLQRSLALELLGDELLPFFFLSCDRLWYS